MLMFICIYVCIYVVTVSSRIMIILFWCYMYICMYGYCCLTKSLGIILMEEWLLTHVNNMKRFLVYEEASGKVVLKNIRVQYHVVMIWYYVIILCLCYGQAIPRDRSVKWKQCGRQHVGTSMDKTRETRFLGRNSVVLDV